MPQFILCDCCGKSVEDFESRLEYFKHLQIAQKCKNCDKDFLSKRERTSQRPFQQQRLQW